MSRDRCLVPLKLALESKNMKLAQNALTGMQKLLSEERFISMETDAAEKQLLNQMLDAVKITPSLHEDLQVEVMKILLCITYSSNFEMNRDSILKIAELCLACHIPGSLRMHEMIKISITQILSSLCRRVFVDANPKTSISHKVCTETYMSSCHQRSINTAVRATLSQMLSDLTLQLRQRQENVHSLYELHERTELKTDALATEESLCEDIVSVLAVFCEKLQGVINENKQLQLLYLECILSMLSSCPPSMHLHKGFTDLIWKQLCPALIVILGNPMNDKTITSAHGGVLQEMDTSSLGLSDHGRGSGCSSSAPTLIGPVARTIYCIATELVRLVSCVESMKPVLQSLYHRILLYPPPQHRVEAIKIMKEVKTEPSILDKITYTVVMKLSKDILYHKLCIMDGMSEACMKGGIEACFSSVSCVCSLLGALDELSQGKGLQPEQVNLLMRRLEELKDGAESTRESMEINEADFRWQRHVLSSEHTPWEPGNERSPDISISVTTDTGQTTLEGDLGQTTPEENTDEPNAILPSPCGQDNGEISSREAELETNEQPDVIQRSHALVYPDITNFLSVECRARSHGSRYSESNFSVDEQDLSRTEFDSCDQYSMAAEKDSGRSDVSDMGSDNCSLADEEQTPRDCPGQRSLRTAALSLKLLKNQEADQHSARLFVQSLVNLLPRLLSLQSTTEVDSSLQNFSSTFCLGLQVGGMHSPGFEASNNLSCQALMNADGLYLVSYYAILLNLKLCCCDYYRKKPAPVLVSLCVNVHPLGLQKEFVRQIQSSGVLVVLSQAWIEELYHQVLDRNLLGEAGYWGTAEQHSLPLITMLTGVVFARYILIGCWKNLIDTLSTPLTGRMAGSSKGLVFILGAEGLKEQNQKERDTICLSLDGLRKAAGLSCALGVVFARYILIGCWKNLIDTLSTPLTGRMAGSSKGLVFILGAEGLKEQNQKERDTICLSLDGLRKAAGLSCALGVAANCASALAQMAAASCVQEDKDDKEAPEFSDTISQVKQKVEQKLEQMGRPQGVRLHTAHVLCMDAILNVGLEMGSHNHDCWPHVFRVCEYVSTLEHSHFSDGSTQPAVTITQAQQGVEIALELRQDNSLEQDLTLSHPVIQPLSIQELLKETSKGKVFDFRGGSLLSGSSAAKAVCTLSTQADRLFEDAANKLNLSALVGFLHQLRKASQAQLFNSVTEMGAYSLAMPGEAKSTQDNASALHLFRLGDVMLRIVRSKSRPLLHMMRAWNVVAPHLVEAACHKERHVSQKAVSFIHDVLTEVLCTWSELPHFHFNEALFRPFEHIMQLELCDEDVQDQVITSIGELVEVCSPQIKSGWRPLFSALRTVHGNKTDVKDYLAQLTTTTPALTWERRRRTHAVLRSMCRQPTTSFTLQACHAATQSYSVGGQCSSGQLTGRPVGTWPVYRGLVGGKCQAPVFDVFEAFISTDNIQVFANAATDYIMCLMKFVKGLGEVDCKEIGDCVHGSGYSSTDLCLPALDYLRRCSQVDIGYESMINLMLKDLFKLLVACVAEPTETISRVGCSCIRYVLVTAGPVFTEERWRLSCCALQDAFSATLEPVKNLLACFHSGSDSFSGDACEVKVAAPCHSATAEAEYWRIRAMAQQVFMLDTQCSPKTPNSKEGFEHAQSCVLIIELPADEKTNGHTQKRIPFRTIVVSLLSHQVLLQNLYDILLEEFVKSSFQAEPQEKTTPVSETKPAGFLKYISMQNLAIIFDLLLDSYRTARDFDTRPGLKYLLMKVSGVCGAANLYRQSAMSFNIYFQALICATLNSQENITAEQVKKILYEEEEGSTDSSQQCSSEDEDIFEETAQVSPPRGKEKRQWRAKIPSLSIQPTGNADWAWLVKRLHKLCMDLCTNYIQMHLDLESNMDEPPVLKADTIFFLPLFPSETSTPSTGGLSRKATPSEESIRNQVVETPAEETPTSGLSTSCLPPLTHKLEKREQGKKKEWWESAGNKLYTIATDKTISKLMVEYKKRKQQHNLTTFVKESKNDKKGDLVTLRGPDSPVPQRPQQLVDQGQMRHSFSAGPEVLRQEKRPRSGSMASAQNISLRDAEAQIQSNTDLICKLNSFQFKVVDFFAILIKLYPQK
ncbi:UNVERIFIED_CONTAM: hypothetical protein FKN15_040786 [Acipenser sinensis]